MKKFIVAGVAFGALTGHFAVADTMACSLKMGMFESKTSVLKKTPVDIKKSIVAAEKEAPGSVLEADLDNENGCLVYKIKILDAKGIKHKIYVDPKDAKVLKSLID